MCSENDSYCMAFQRFSVADGLGLFMCCSEDEEELSEDEMIGNFMTEGGETIVLSSEMLSQRLHRHPLQHIILWGS